jgi:DNA repair photolyase
VIISASRRTDIPAFYSEWFMQRIKDGFFFRVNPFNSKMVKKFSLSIKDVDVIVFWTKNPKPLIKHLDDLNSKGYNYYFQFTLNDYPKIFEPNVPAIEDRIEIFQELSQKIGPRKVIWRYDPIILSSITPITYHLEKLEYISQKISGSTERIIISFLDFYGKVKNRIKKLGKDEKIEFMDLIEDDHRNDLYDLVKSIKSISIKAKLRTFTCAEIIDLDDIGIEHGSCIDIGLIRDLFNIHKLFHKDKSQRKECLCGESVDMGMYDTCRFQCNYCYANSNPKKIMNNLAKYNVNNPSLVRSSTTIEESSDNNNRLKNKQLTLI